MDELKHDYLDAGILATPLKELGIKENYHSGNVCTKFCTVTTKVITDCIGMDNDEDIRESGNDGVEVNLADPRESQECATACKMTKCEKDLAQENEKMDKCTECDTAKIMKNELSFHEDEMRMNSKKLQCPLKIPGMSENSDGNENKRNSCGVRE